MKILIIEDNESLAKTLKMAFKKEGFDVNYVTDGEEGEKEIIFRHDNYDLIILDLMLPAKNGFEIYGDIRKKKISTPVIALTGRTSDVDKNRAFNLGIDYYITKPFSFNELLKWAKLAIINQKRSYNKIGV